jgi:hypothetical protein
MSGHLRCGFAVFFLAAGLARPAAANVLTDLFTPKAAPEAAPAAPAPAPEQCLRQPGAPLAGHHWVYRLDGHRKCWFQAAEDSAVAKKPVRHLLARRRVAAPEEDEPAPHKQKAAEDARAELVNSAPAQRPEPALPASAPAEMPQPTPSVQKLTMLHSVPIQVADAAAQVPPELVPTTFGVDQLTSDRPRTRHVDVEALLAEAPAASDEVSAAPATSIAAPGAPTAGGEEWIASWLGVLLMALGCATLLSASRTFRRAVWPVRFLESRTELPDIAQGGWNELFFDRSASHRPARAEPGF